MYEDEEAIAAMVGEALESIRRAVSEKPYVFVVDQRLDDLFAFGMADKFRKLFGEIELDTGSIENRAIRATSAGAHSRTLESDERTWETIRLTAAMHALLDRVILKLLSYEGKYLDRSTLGWPERDISEPLAGPLENGFEVGPSEPAAGRDQDSSIV